MKKIFLSIYSCLIFVIAFGQNEDNLKVQKYILDNGLTVYLNEDHSEPKVFGAVAVRVGSKNDPEKSTGMAHYFEHIMFKGTDSIGTLDYASEKPYLDSITMLYDILYTTTDKDKRNELQIQINNLAIKASEYAIPNEVDKLIKKYGGTQVNAYTSYDQTVYHNTFPPSQMEQWLDIYAERFRKPIFRLFQSELETVYEERNMYADVMGSKLFEDIFKFMFKKHPYKNPLIGTVEDLKNPSISKMEKFYKDYYVANNMALILTGDFDSEKTLNLVKEKFGNWRNGEVPVFPTEKYREDPYEVREFKSGRYLPIKIGAILYRTVPKKHADEVAIDFCGDILSNSGTGLLDALRNENKVMEANASSFQFNDEGMMMVMFVPKIFGGSLKKTEKMVMQYIDSLKNGNFSEELLNSIKISYRKQFAQQLENPTRRANLILNAYISGYTWEEYVAKMDKYSSITKEEIVAAANKYFIDNHLVFYNKAGLSSKAEKIKKPPYKPVVPANTEKESVFAQNLEKVKKTITEPIFVDFQKDFKYADIKDRVHLVTGDNPVNNIFSLSISFGTGEHKDSLLSLIDHISELGTETKTYKEFKQDFQNLGSSFYLYTNKTSVNMSISGFDENFEKTMLLINELLSSIKPDDAQMKKLIDDAESSKKVEKKDQNTLDDALYEYVVFGDNSDYINRLTIDEIKKIKSKDIVDAFKKARNYETTITYIGKLSFDQVSELLIKNIGFSDNLIEKDTYITPCTNYSKNQIFVCNNPKSIQAAVNIYIPSEKVNDNDRLKAYLFNQYFGVGMNSIMFQEIREFRSLSYSARGSFRMYSKKYPEQKGYFLGALSTQTDKTNEAIDLLNELVINMPEKPDRIDNIKDNVVESINSSKPNFRSTPQYGYSLIDQGYTEDTRKLNLEYTQTASFEDILDFYNNFIKGKPIIYTITGNIKNMDIKALEKYGEVTEIKIDNIIKN